MEHPIPMQDRKIIAIGIALNLVAMVVVSSVSTLSLFAVWLDFLSEQRAIKLLAMSVAVSLAPVLIYSVFSPYQRLLKTYNISQDPFIAAETIS